MAMDDKTTDDRTIAHKLHSQFGHPSPIALIKLIKNAGIKNKKLHKEVHSISNSCVTCLKHKRPSPRPVVCLPLASRFNEMVGIDLKKWGDSYFLVIVDIATRFCQAYVIHNKLPSTIIKALFVTWITIFGAPQKILSDNGGEFSNNDMRELSDIFCIKLLSTAAESPWSNGICERLNGTLGELVSKIVEDTNCGVQIALAWAVAARNAFYNKSGVSPNQLVFGFNPSFPNIYDSNLPASSLEDASTDIVRKNSDARNKAREIFIKYEANERIRKALRHNIRHTEMETLIQGDEVLYKRKDNKWHGPGKVTNIDLRAKTVTVNHGGFLIKVHAVSLLKMPATPVDQQIDCDTEDIDDISFEQPNQENNPKTPVEAPLVQTDLGPRLKTVKLDALNTDVNVIETVNDQAHTNEQYTITENENNEEQRNVQTIEIQNLKGGQRFQGIDKNTGQHISGKILNRAGKVKGSNKHCYNVETDSTGWRGWVDMKNIKDLQLLPDESQIIILFNSAEVSKAKEMEIKNWIDNKVFDEIEDTGQHTISVRWVITEKGLESNLLTKARLVARGFEEQTTHLKKDSPTCSREIVRLVVVIASSKGWNCHTVDVKAAYLQGDDIQREVYLRPPDEYNIGKVWKLNKTVYGLCDAARAWYIRVKNELIELGVQKCPLDNSLFFWHINGILEGVICVYVDDFLFAGTHNFIENIIKKFIKKFQIGNTGNINFTYVGLRVNSYNDGLTLDQEHYIASITGINISKERVLEKNSELTKKEMASFRTLVGQLSWISTHTRPDIAFETCELGSAFTGAKITDLIKLNKLVERLKNTSVHLYFPRLRSLRKCTIKCFTDASFRNLPNEGSQAGFIIFLHTTDDNKRCPIYWQSRKIDRVVDSTLAAETVALHEGAKTSIYLANVIKQMMSDTIVQVICITDNKSLVDALSSTKMMKDRWLRLNILGLCSMLEKGEIDKVEWIDSKNQLADTLTKKGTCRDKLIHSISRN